MQIGLDRCRDEPPSILRGRRFGLLMNQASVDRRFHYACDVLHERLPGQLAALFSPQHGLWCEEQANMVESPHARYAPLDLPVYSLYSQTREPAPDMLAGLECLVIDLQDVGTRVYTFAWTIQNCLRVCAAAKVAVVILDRPNPLGGAVIEGPLLRPEYQSFVGGATIPMRHGLTLGELASLINVEQHIGADLTVVTMDGWRRAMLYDETALPWVPPSPNMPRVTTALLYPGQVLLEGTNLSEGRGTTLPFEVVGAPFIDPYQLASELTTQNLPGVAIRPLRFVPTFDKFRGQRCGGVAFHVTEPQAVRSFALTLHLVTAAARLWPEHFEWLPPPYEYEYQKMPIDILFGSNRLIESLPIVGGSESAQDAHALVPELAAVDAAAWWQRVKPYLLYEN